ncbi:hypothetical protein BGW38_002735 [Lunasporangiospora selenospora]|uniref:Uncharacterized protein n=1 Tax=Lunasporangiospora selenospora TaxID=979761 RepID=A0A9P6FSB5_9FUNG|nr:hypothetical protein BGW38_002735 [Lunasporangiospora selenospora]
MKSFVVLFLLVAMAQMATVMAKVCLCDGGVHHRQGDRSNGCHKGYCWAFCQGAGCALTVYQNEWCYTSLDYSQSFNYMKCNTDADCTKHAKTYCAGSCTVSPFGVGSPDFDKYC